MLGRIADILKKTAISKAFWVGLLLCLSFTCINPAPATADYEDECPSMQVLQERYQGDCFPCQIVNVLLGSFMRAAGKVYDVSKEAGNKLLFLGSALWVAFWALRKMSSLSNVEPASMSNELVVFLGKVVVAYCFINAGIGTLVSYAINPILGAGAEFGTALLVHSENMDMTAAPKSENAYSGPADIISKDTMDKLLKLSEGVSNEVAYNLIIGNALTCFSIVEGIHWSIIIDIHIPDIWLWLCGAAIWLAGFMLVLSVCYYLVDIPFKIGFAIIALPVVIGLWPFKMTSGKFGDVIKIAFNAAGTFLFLALSSSYAMRLINESFSTVNSPEGTTLRGADALLYAFQNDNVEYVDKVFTITSGSFLIIMFCYIYGIKMIEKVTKDFPDKFFKSSLSKSMGSPIHHMATGATMWAANKAAAPFKTLGNIAAHQAGKAATTVAKAGGNVALGLASAQIGVVSKYAGKGIKWAGTKWAEKAKSKKDSWDSLSKYDDMRNAGINAKIGNAVGRLGSRINLGLANALKKTGELTENTGDTMISPLSRTANRVGNAWKAGMMDIGDAAKEVADEAVGNPHGDVKAVAQEQLSKSIENLKSETKRDFKQIGKAFKSSGGKLKRFVTGQTFVADFKKFKSEVATDWNLDVKAMKDSASLLKENTSNFGAILGEHIEDHVASTSVSMDEAARAISKEWGKDVKTGISNLGESIVGLGSTIKKEVGAGTTGTIAASLTTGPVVAAGARHLYNNTKDAILNAKGAEINDLFDLAGAVVYPAAATALILKNTASDTLESTYNMTEKTLLVGVDAGMAIARVLKAPAKSLIHGANVLTLTPKIVATPILMTGGMVVNTLDTAYKGVRTVTRPVLNTIGTVALAPVGYAAKAVDESLYTVYNATVRPAATIVKTVGRVADVAYRGVVAGVASTKIGRGVGRTLRTGSKTLKVAAKTLNLGRNLIRAAAGEGEFLSEKQSKKDIAKAREERKLRQKEAQEKAQKRREAQERKRREQERLEDLRDAANEARRRADDAEERAEKHRKAAEEAQREAEEHRLAAENAEREAEEHRLAAEEARRKEEEAAREAEESRRRIEEATEALRRIEEEKRAAEEAVRKAEEERRETEEAQRQLEEIQARLDEAEKERKEANLKAEEAQREAEDRARKAEESEREAEKAKEKSEKEKRNAAKAKEKADEKQKIADDSRVAAEEAKTRSDEEQRKLKEAEDKEKDVSKEGEQQAEQSPAGANS